MDPIPDADGQRLRIQVPYLAHDIQYDGLGWDTFPARTGYAWVTSQHLTVQDIEEHISPANEADIQGFLQAWLYFGLLHEVLGDKYDINDFLAVPKAHGRSNATTRSLRKWSLKIGNPFGVIFWVPSLTFVWFNGWTILSRRRLFDIHQLIIKVMEQTLLWDTFAKGKDKSWGKLTLSIYILAESLQAIPLTWIKFKYYWDDYKPITRHFVPNANVNQHGASIQLVRRHMLRNSKAWCIHQVDTLCAKVSYTTLVYLTGIQRHERHGVDHAHCSRNPACVAFSIALGKDFVTKHATSECTCASVEAPRAEQIHILERGGIPVLKCVQKESGTVDLSFVPMSPALKYVAISHVWADGLGDPFGHGLPRCQLLRLIADARNALRTRAKPFRDVLSDTFTKRSSGFRPNSPVYIWLDVYCIPPQNTVLNAPEQIDRLRERDAYLKKKAIARMGMTYALADRTLVLDQELEHSRPNSMASLRDKALVALSAWNGRCWTFQEYSFSQFTLFGFQGLPEWEGLRQWTPVETSRHTAYSLLHDEVDKLQAAFRVSTGYSLRTQLKSSPMSFADAWDSFFGRTTTQWDDMAEVLANLLNLSAGHLLRLEGASRMKAILASQHMLPLSLLFAPLERPEDDPSTPFEERWIPESVQSTQLASSDLPIPHGTHDRNAIMHVTDEGLLLKAKELAGTATKPSTATLVRLSVVGKSSSHLSFSLECWHGHSCGLRHRCWTTINDEVLSRGRASVYATPQQFTQDVVLLLDMLHPLCGRDHSATFRGACFLPNGRSQDGLQGVTYCGPIEWGTAPIPAPATAPSAEIRDVDLLVLSRKPHGLHRCIVKPILTRTQIFPRGQSFLHPATRAYPL